MFRPCPRTGLSPYIRAYLVLKGQKLSLIPPCKEPMSALSTGPSAESTDPQEQQDPILQYIVLRRDMWGHLNWPLGSIVAQGCHASTAALWAFKDDPLTQQYCDGEALDSMRKVQFGRNNLAVSR